MPDVVLAELSSNRRATFVALIICRATRLIIGRGARSEERSPVQYSTYVSSDPKTKNMVLLTLQIRCDRSFKAVLLPFYWRWYLTFFGTNKSPHVMGGSNVIQLRPTSLEGMALAIPLLLASYQLSTYLYNMFFHPLRKFPGPITAAASNIPFNVTGLKGDGVFWVVELHRRYGDVVRIAPNELSFSGNGAYKDIYGHKKAGQPALQKDPKFYRSPSGVRVPDVSSSSDEVDA